MLHAYATTQPKTTHKEMAPNEGEACSALVAAADALVASPLQLTDEAARAFLEAHPLESVFRTLNGAGIDKHSVEVISTALNKVLATPYGTSLLPSTAGYAQAALASREPRLRRLAAAQLGRLLLLPSSGGGDNAHAAATAHADALAGLCNALEDADGGVAADAGGALARYGASSASRLAELLDASAPAGARLRAIAAGGGAIARHRAYACLVEAASGGGGSSGGGNNNAAAAGAAALRRSGVLDALAGELDPSDPLSALAALQLLDGFAASAGAPVAAQLVAILAPRVPALLADPTTAAGALPVAARLVATAAELLLDTPQPPAAAAAAANGNHAGPTTSSSSNGNGTVGPMEVDNGDDADHSQLRATVAAAAAQLLRHLAAALDDARDATADDEVAALDAAGALASTRAGAALVAGAGAAGAAAGAAAPPTTLLPAIAERALGRAGGGAPEVRVAALHALAAAAGGERAGAARDRRAAHIPGAGAEAALRSAVFGGSVARGWAASPSEAFEALLRQPFSDLRAALYRAITALALRAWFAADVANAPALLARVCDPRSESGQMCQWRHAAVSALLATASEVAAGAEDAAEDGGGAGEDGGGSGGAAAAAAAAHRSALAAALGQLRAAEAAGPYGAAGGGGGAASRDHFVASRPR